MEGLITARTYHSRIVMSGEWTLTRWKSGVRMNITHFMKLKGWIPQVQSYAEARGQDRDQGG